MADQPPSSSLPPEAGSRLTVGGQLSDLEKREALLESILATIPDGLVVIDEKGIIQSFSAAAERLFGHAAGEVVGRSVNMLMPSPHREHHDSYIERYLKSGERKIIGVARVVRGLRKDGSTMPLELAVGEIKLEQGRLFTGFVRDLTERQEREQRLHELQAELIHVSRLGELGQMVSALAHEVNQPLTALQNYLRASQRLLESGDSQKARNAFVKAAEQAERANQIIRRLRTFVKKGETGRRVENVHKVVEEAAALSLVGLKERKLNVVMRLSEQAQSAYIDKIQIQQVLFNLMRNAIEAMQDRPEQLLCISAEPGDANTVVIRVSDSGPGLHADVRAKLFQPFVTTKESGLGVGLSICRSIIESHGGQMSAAERPGGGTVFSFTIPATPEAEFAT